MRFPSPKVTSKRQFNKNSYKTQFSLKTQLYSKAGLIFCGIQNPAAALVGEPSKMPTTWAALTEDWLEGNLEKQRLLIY